MASITRSTFDRIVGLLTKEEDTHVRTLSAEFASHPVVVDAREIVAIHFVSPDGIGRLRIREHPLYIDALDLDRLGKELAELLSVNS